MRNLGDTSKSRSGGRPFAAACRRWAAVAAVATAVVLAGVGADAQQQVDQNAGNLPPVPPQGAWGQVIMANRNWVVVQNQRGEQFPIAADAVSQFLIRWPSNLDSLTANSVVEAIGPDMGNNTVMTEHVDFFEGAATQLVTPTFTSILPNNKIVTTIDPGFNRFMNAFDVGAQNTLHGWAYPVNPNDNGMPVRLHVVGNAVNTNPLRLSVLGTNFANVVPGANGLSVTQITTGTPSMAEKGDLAFLMPTNLTTRTVVLSQLVLYKKTSLREFRMP